MRHIQGVDRNQMMMISLEDFVQPQSFVRIIDAFVDSMDAVELGFKNAVLNQNGRPPFHPADLIKLYLYGVKYKKTSTRELEDLCEINIEVKWLLKGKKPHNRTICNFLKDNTDAIKSLFKNFNLALKSWELIEGKEFAVDSTKIRANNSNSKSFNQKTIDNKKKYHHYRAEAFTKAFEEAQQKGDQQAIKKIKKLKKKTKNR